MSPLFVRLLGALSDLPGRPGDLRSFIAAAPPPGALPPPYLAWPLLGLLRYLGRKRWAWGVIRQRLRAQLRRPAKKRRETITDVLASVQRGIIPGLPDWEYYLDGNDSHLTHRGTRERIHVDVLNGPELIPEHAFARHYSTHREPGPAERRLGELFPEGRGLSLALRVLRRKGLLHPTFEGEFELCGEVSRHTGAVERFLDRWENPEDRLWLAALLGDWPAADATAERLGRGDLTALTRPRAESCRWWWAEWLRRRAGRAGLYDDLLCALAHAGVPDLPRYLEQGLEEPEAAWAALDLITGDATWCPRVFGLLTESAYAPYGGLDEKAALYLGHHRHRVREVIDHLLAQEWPLWDVLITLALDGAPDRLPGFLPEGLRSRRSEDRRTAAAVLTLRDDEWGRRLLLAVLSESRSLDRTVEARAALRLSRAPEAARAVECWEASHPEEGAPPPTSDRFWYALHGGCEQQLRDRMAELRERVERLRPSEGTPGANVRPRN
jgi:hypothetical protein